MNAPNTSGNKHSAPDSLPSDLPPTIPPERAAEAQETTASIPVRPATRGPVQVSGYAILGELGRGGMGVVYQARHLQLNRVVALKMVLAGGHAGSQELARFLTEAEAVAALQHPNIVQVFDYGRQGELPYMALEFVNGGNLASRLHEGLPRPLDAAWLVEQLARGMTAAHAKGIIHRDLKPQNVLLALPEGKTPEQAALTACTPKLTDFGLAKKVENGSGLTQTGAVMGTPSYMAPEQAMAMKDIGPAADVYALGAILYECLTGRPPFRGSTPLETLMQVISDEPAAVRQLQPNCPADLEAICHKCLHKDTGKRYGSAAALAEDLRRFQAGEPIMARPVGWPERGWRWCLRHRAVASLLATVAATLLLGTTVATVLAVSASRQAQRADRAAGAATEEKQKAETAADQAHQDRDRAETEKTRAEEQLRRAEWATYLNQLTLAQVEWDQGSPAKAWEHLERCQWDLRGWEHHYLTTRFNKNTLRAHRLAVTSVAISPDGKRMVSASGDGTAKVWDLERGREILSLTGHTGALSSVAFRPDGKRIVSASYDKSVKVWDADSGAAIHSLVGHTGFVNSAAFSADGKRIVSASHDKTVKVWDAERGTEMLTLKGHTSNVTCAVFSALARIPGAAPGDRIVSGSWDKTVKVWDAASGTAILTLNGHTHSVHSVVCSPDGKRIVSGGQDYTVKVWDAERGGAELLSLKGHKGAVNSVALSADGKQILSASEDQTVRVWDRDQGTEIRSLKGHTDAVNSVAISSNGTRIVTGCHDTTVKVWDARQDSDTRTLRHTIGVSSVAISADGKRLVSASMDRTVKVWDADKGAELHTLVHSSGLLGVALSADGKRVVTAANDGKLHVWDADSGAERLTLKGHSTWARSVAISADGKRVASVGGPVAEMTRPLPGEIKVWDADNGDEILSIKGGVNGVFCVALRADGNRIAAGGMDRNVVLWDVRTGSEVLTLSGHVREIQGLAFSPDGKRLVSASSDSTLKVWDTGTGAEVLSLHGHASDVSCVAISADGKRIISGGFDNAVKVWDADTGAETLTLNGHASTVTSVAISAAGNRIVSGSSGGFGWTGKMVAGEIKIWDADMGAEARSLRGHASPVIAVAISATPPNASQPAAPVRRQRLVGAARDITSAQVWDVAKGTATVSLRGHTAPITSAAISSSGHRIVTGSQDGTVRVWDADSGLTLQTLKGHAGWVRSVAISPDGSRVVSINGSALMRGSPLIRGEVRVWDAETGALLHVLKGHTAAGTAVALSADGRRIVSASGGADAMNRLLAGEVKVWDAVAGAEILTLQSAPNVRAVAISADGQRILSANGYNPVQIWDAGKGNAFNTLKGQTGWAVSVAISADGKRIVTSAEDNSVKVWDADTLTEVRAFKGHTYAVLVVAISPDGQRIASGSADRTVKVWDVVKE